MARDTIRIRVARRRHGWQRGAFDDLVGQRIPFPTGPLGGDAMVGRLVRYEENERELAFEFAECEREGG
jgi:hypothetical protein